MIEVGRNSIIVRGISNDSQEYKNAQYRFSLYDKVCHKYTFSAFVEDGDVLYFPSSIGKENIQSVFPKEEVIVNYSTTAKAKLLYYNMKHLPRDELQTKAIQFLMKIKKDQNIRQRFLSLETRKG